MRSRILFTILSLISILIMVSTGATHNSLAIQKERPSYIIQAEEAAGQWKVGSVSYGQSEYFPAEDLKVRGAYINEKSPDSVKSWLEFRVPLPGYYLIGARLFTERREGSPIDVSMLLRNSEGNLIVNQFENNTVGYSRSYNQGGWVMPILGLWNIPKGEVKLTFGSSSANGMFMAIDYFYLTPMLGTKGGRQQHYQSVLGPHLESG